MGAQIVDLTNKVFGYLTVIKLNHKQIRPNGGSKLHWLCKCVCGKEKVIVGNHLKDKKNRRIVSCGNHPELSGIQNIKNKMASCHLDRKHFSHGFCKSCYFNQYQKRLRLIKDDSITPQLLNSLYSQEICAYCQNTTPREKRTVDHVIPIKQDGPHTASNLVMACRSCNCKKWKHSLVDFMS